MKKIKNVLKPNSLRWQLIERFILILLLLLVIMETFQYTSTKQYLYSSKEQILDARFHNIEENAFENIKVTELLNNSSKIIDKTIDENMCAAVIDVNGKKIASRSKMQSLTDIYDTDSDKLKKIGKAQIPLPIPELSQKQYKELLKRKGTLEGYRLVKDKNNNLQIVGFRKIGNTNSPVGLLQLAISAKPVQDILARQLQIYIIASLLILLIGAIVAGKVFKYTLKPLYNMKDTVEHINVGQLDKRLTIHNGQIEIDSLSNAFNKMLEGIQISFQKEMVIKEKMRRFVSDASHELRTPLTSIHGFVEVLLRGAAKNEEQLHLALNSILIESERMTNLVNDLLLLNRLDKDPEKDMHLEKMSDIIEEVYPQLNILSETRKIELKLKDDIYVYVNRNKIKQVIFNLVQNAVRHTDEKKGRIIISTDDGAISSNGYAVLKVKDNGTGITEEHLGKIFDRFFRSEEHRARKNGGYGLGLSIVKSIVDAHGGKIDVKSEVGVGTTFYIFLKKDELN